MKEILNNKKSITINDKTLIVEIMETGCWQPVSHKAKTNGYHVLKCYDDESRLLHRCSYRYFNNNGKKLPEKMIIMHTCDNRLCCNPDHLKLGTSSENNQDCHDKNRSYAKHGFTETHKDNLKKFASNRKINHTCTNCGIEFFNNCTTSKLCDHCKSKGIKNLVKKFCYNKVCKKCGKEYKGTAPTQKICFECKGVK